jgi:TetR/AcrR family transcriptional regulator, cholesterol catabolism regulator
VSATRDQTGARKPRPGRQDDILKTFTEKVALQGYDGTSLGEIAAELGLSKGTIMHHYGAKENILRQMSLGYMERRLAELQLIAAEYDSPAERLAAIITALITGFRDDRAATLAFSREFMRFSDQPVMEEVRAQREVYSRMVRDELERGMAQGVFRRLDSRIVTLQVIGMCNWGWTWIDPSGPLTVEAIAGIYIETIVGGLLVRQDEALQALLPTSIVAARAGTVANA